MDGFPNESNTQVCSYSYQCVILGATLENVVFVLNETTSPVKFTLKNMNLDASQTWTHEGTHVIIDGISTDEQKYAYENQSLIISSVGPDDAGSYYLTARTMDGSGYPSAGYLAVLGNASYTTYLIRCTVLSVLNIFIIQSIHSNFCCFPR